MYGNQGRSIHVTCSMFALWKMKYETVKKVCVLHLIVGRLSKIPVTLLLTVC